MEAILFMNPEDAAPADPQTRQRRRAALTAVRSRLVQWLRSRVSGLSEVDGEDVAQDAFAALLGSDAAEAVEDLTAWLFRAARNRRTDLIRAKKETVRLDRDDADGGTVELPDARLSAHEALEKSQVREALFAALSDLDEDERRLVEAVELEGRTHEEVAHELGIPLGTALAKKHRALRKLRGLMESRGHPTPI